MLVSIRTCLRDIVPPLSSQFRSTRRLVYFRTQLAPQAGISRDSKEICKTQQETRNRRSMLSDVASVDCRTICSDQPLLLEQDEAGIKRPHEIRTRFDPERQCWRAYQQVDASTIREARRARCGTASASNKNPELVELASQVCCEVVLYRR